MLAVDGQRRGACGGGVTEKLRARLAPRGAVNTPRVTARGLLLPPAPAAPDQWQEAAVERPAPCRETAPGCYKGSRGLCGAQNNCGTAEGRGGSFSRQIPHRARITTMTLEEVSRNDNTMDNAERVQSAGAALEELLLAAKKQDYLTVGVYESAKVMNVDPDSVAFCVLAADAQHECDIALQIHFTLIQAFCFDNDINVVRVNDIDRLADLVGADESGEPKDAHCILVTSPSANPWKDPALDQLGLFCEESHSAYDWVPTITLPER